MDDNDIYFGDDQSVITFSKAFKDIGYNVRIEESKETSYSIWKEYDIVVWTCGDDYTIKNYSCRFSSGMCVYITNKTFSLLITLP